MSTCSSTSSRPWVVFNGLVHYRLHRGRMVAWRWLLFLSTMDVRLITASVIVSGELHHFVYVAYFPALALFAADFASFGICLLWTTAVAALDSWLLFVFSPWSVVRLRTICSGS